MDTKSIWFLYLKIFFLLKKLKKTNFLEYNDYDEILKLLCNRKKMRIFKLLISDIFLLLKAQNLLENNVIVDINYKSLKIMFVSLFTHRNCFYNIVFNNNTEYNSDLKKISQENYNIIKNIYKYKFKKVKLIMLANNLCKFINIYNKWEIIDKRINTQKLLINHFELKLNIDLLEGDIVSYNNNNSNPNNNNSDPNNNNSNPNNNNSDPNNNNSDPNNNNSNLSNNLIIKNAYIKELNCIEQNVRYMNDNNELKYFNTMKTNYHNYQKIQEELYWQKIKYEISCEDKFKDTILKLVEKTKKMFIDCIPNNLQVKNEIHDVLDLDILSNMLTIDNENDILDYSYLEGKLFYMLDVLKRFQSPSSDKSYEEWCNEIKNRMNNRELYKDLVPFFFKELFDRLINILDEIQRFKENIVI